MGASRVVALPGTDGSLDWRVRYHYGSERDETRAWRPETWVVTLAEGRLVRAAPSRHRLTAAPTPLAPPAR